LLRKTFLQRWMDCRVKPGNDGGSVPTAGVRLDRCRLAQIPRLLEPSDRIGNRLAIGPRGIAKLTARLGVIEEHVMARHAQPVASGKRRASGEAREPFGAARNRVERGYGKSYAGLPARNHFGGGRDHLAQAHVLPAQDISLAQATAAQPR